jgi:hypothetical protein
MAVNAAYENAPRGRHCEAFKFGRPSQRLNKLDDIVSLIRIGVNNDNGLVD